MKIRITCRHSNFSEKLQKHTASHVQSLERFGEHFESGEIIFDNGLHTGALPGRLVRRSDEKSAYTN